MTHKRVTAFICGIIMAFGVLPVCAENTVKTYYVSPNGSDDSTGAETSPYRTIEKAVSAAKSETGQTEIILRGGRYEVSKTINLGSDCSNLKFAAYPGEKPVISGGKTINPKEMYKLADDEMLKRLKPEARGYVYNINLRECSITDFGRMQRVERHNQTTWDAPSFLTINGEIMPRAQWPNGGYTKILAVNKDQSGRPVLSLEDDRAKNWSSIKDVWMYGCFSREYADDSMNLDEYNAETGEYTLRYDLILGAAVGGSCKFVNVFEELDSPGEWYVDTDTGMLYLYTDNIDGIESMTYVTKSGSLFNIENTSGISYSGITFTETCGSAVIIRNSSGISFENCEFYDIGNEAANLYSSTGCSFNDCYIHDTGKGGIFISGAGSSGLTPNGNVIDGCHFERFAVIGKRYSPAVSLMGVGDVLKNSTIHDSPHSAVLFGGNNNIIENNDIYDVVKETLDAGAIYGGRSWMSGGNTIRYNFIHDMPYSNVEYAVSGVYLDDNMAGIKVYGNTFSRVNNGVYMHSACYCDIYNNLFTEINKNAVYLTNLDGMSKASLDYENRKIKNANLKELYNNVCEDVLSEAGTGNDTDTAQKIDEKFKDEMSRKGIYSKMADVIADYFKKYDSENEVLNNEYPYLKNMLNCDNPVAPKNNNITNNLVYKGSGADKIKTQGYAADLSSFSANSEVAEELAYTTDSPVTVADGSVISSVFKDGFGGLDITHSGSQSIKHDRKNFRILSPVNSMNNVAKNDVFLTWEIISGADEYKVELAADRGMKDNIYTAFVSESYIRLDNMVEYGKTYYWKVTGIFHDLYRGGRGGWLDNQNGVQSFTIEETPAELTLDKVIIRNSRGIESKSMQEGELNIVEFTAAAKNSDIGDYTFEAVSFDSSGNEYTKATVKLSVNSDGSGGGMGIILPQEAKPYMLLKAFKDGVIKKTWKIDENLISWGSGINGVHIKSVTVRDANGNKSDMPNAAGGTIEVEVENDSDKMADLFAAAAGYSDDNELVWADSESVSIKKGSIYTAILNIGTVAGTLNRLFIWNNQLSPWLRAIDLK